MIKLYSPNNTKRYYVLVDAADEKIITELNLSSNSITNKFHLISKLIEDMGNIEGFNLWYKNMFLEYIEQEKNPEIIIKNAEKFKEFSEKYIIYKKIDFSKYSRIEKASRTSIFFSAEDIKSIIKTSICLKLYSPISCDTKLKFPPDIQKKIYDIFIQECLEKNVQDKIFQITKSRILKSKQTDKYMWELIKSSIQETPETFVLNIFNFLTQYMIAILDIHINPIPFLVSIVDDSIKWLMKSIYTEKTLYNSDVFGGSEEIYGSTLSKDSFYIMACQSSASRFSIIGLELLEKEYKLSEEHIEKIKEKLDSIDIIPPSYKLLNLLFCSKIFEIPYKYLLTCPSKYITLMSIVSHYCSKNMLYTKYPLILDFLTSVVKDTNIVTSTRSSYRPRNLELLVNTPSTIYGFSSRKLKYDVFGCICGCLASSRKNLISLIDWKTLNKSSIYDLEENVMNFYGDYYSGKLDHLFKEMTITADSLI